MVALNLKQKHIVKQQAKTPTFKIQLKIHLQNKNLINEDGRKELTEMVFGFTENCR